MERASKILIKIGVILCIVLAVMLILMALPLLVCGVSPTVREMLIDAYYDGTINTDIENPELFASVMQMMLLSMGITFIIFDVLLIVTPIVVPRLTNNPSKRGYIGAIILGAFASNLILVGAILGLVAFSRKANQPQVE